LRGGRLWASLTLIVKFKAQNAEVLVVAQETPADFSKLWQEEGFPFVGLPDDNQRVAKLYNPKVILTKL